MKYIGMSREEEILAFYVVKLTGLTFGSIDRNDLVYLLHWYAAIVMSETTGYNEVSDAMTEHEDAPPGLHKGMKLTDSMFEVLQLKAAKSRCKQPTKASFSNGPVICYRCKGEGHVAKGCKHYECFRCHCVGHVANSCRKRRKVDLKVQDMSASCPDLVFIPEPCEHIQPGEDLQPASAAPFISVGMQKTGEEAVEPKMESPVASQVQQLVSTLEDKLKMEDEPWPDIWSDNEDSDGDRDCDLDSVVGDSQDDFTDSMSEISLEEQNPAAAPKDICIMQGFDINCVEQENSVENEPSKSMNGPSKSITVVEDDDQCQPVWTYLSEELGCDSTRWTLSEFLAHMKAHPDALKDDFHNVLECVQEEIAECKRNGLRNGEMYV